jgi:alpha-tubulin suppressor-like RCC1 family protein
VKVRRGSGFLQNVSSLDAGYFHNCARTSDGGAFCWGYAGDGELGIGPVPLGEEAHKALRVRRDAGAPMRGVRAIRAGDSFSCLLRSNGTVWCMGFSNIGQMGNGATNDITYFPVEALVP